MADIPLAERVDSLEAKVAVLEQLPAQIARLEIVLGDQIRAGDEETRRQMRVRHEDLVERLKTIGKGLNRTSLRRKGRG